MTTRTNAPLLAEKEATQEPAEGSIVDDSDSWIVGGHQDGRLIGNSVSIDREMVSPFRAQLPNTLGDLWSFPC